MESDNSIEQHFTKLIEQGDRTRASVADGNTVAFWMLLYHPLDRVRDGRPSALDMLGLSSSTTHDFLQEVVAFTSADGQAHWAEKAARWLEEVLPVNVQIAAAVDEIVDKNQGSQQSRHVAFRLVSRWHRSNANAA